jgi:hypothetical protein
MATFTILSKSRDLMSPSSSSTTTQEFAGGERDGAGGDRYGGGGQDAPPSMPGQAMNVGRAGGESYVVTLQGPSIVVGAVEFVGDGRSKGSFFVAEPGRYKA